jgi:LysR family transcriptional regulator, transcriptional activator of nhaA
MEWLNYHHLLYFWTVARRGSVAAASAELRLAAPTVSAQIKKLEGRLGEKLLQRSGRRLVLTDAGHLVMSYAQEIFSLGQELTSAIKERPTGRPLRLVVGIADVLPKWIAYRLIEPALHLGERVQVVCREGRPERLLLDLAAHDLDVILSDAPMPASLNVRAFSHLLGDCGTSFFAKPKLAALLRRRFPRSLQGAPFLLPSGNTTFRRSLDQWFELQGVRPAWVGEFDDFALLRTFADAGTGAFAAPSVLDHEMKSKYGFGKFGHTDAVRGRFYAISVERKLKHPAVVAISEAGREKLFARTWRSVRPAMLRA